MPVLQDLHYEFHTPKTRTRLLDEVDPSGVDILVLAGDIASCSLLEEVLGAYCSKYPLVVYVTGNHEYYHKTLLEAHSTLERLQSVHPNLIWLNNQEASVGGLTFVGGTLWYPQGRLENRYKKRINDFRVVQDLESWVYGSNTDCVKAIQASTQADVVVTHHIPHPMCISPRFRIGDNHYFCHDQTEILEGNKPPLWIFGHTHDRMQKTYVETLMVSNPKGYPHEPESEERGPFRDRLLLQVQDQKVEVLVE